MIYRLFFKLMVSARIDAEDAHRLACTALRCVARVPLLGSSIRRALQPRDPLIAVSTLRATFPSPVGLAAGFDKDALSYDALAMLGFGCIEVGTVTAKAQAGKPRPRIWRLPKARAVMNSMGFPNPGADVFAQRLSRRRSNGRSNVVIGVNIGKSKDPFQDDPIEDYRRTTRAVARRADYLALNVSSPNTAGLRAMQSKATLTALLHGIKDELDSIRVAAPILVKIAPDMSDNDLDMIVDTSIECGIDGIIAVNTTVPGPETRNEVDGLADLPTACGGLSGAPLKRRSVEVLERLYARAGSELTLVSVGGIESADDVWERILAGATLVQAHTGFVYGGPLWPHRVNRELAKLVRNAGWSSVQEAVGAGAQVAPGKTQSTSSAAALTGRIA